MENGQRNVDNSNNVVIRVPPTAAHLAVLRTAVGGIAARDSFTLDQVNDLRLAVEEATTQLLRHARRDTVGGGLLEMVIIPTPSGFKVRLTAEVDTPGKVIDESSLSWMILRALADDVQVESQQTSTTVVLFAHRLVSAQDTK